MSEKQKTIKQAISISGAGLHTGAEVEMTFKPAPENHGIKFQRIDLPDQTIVEALVDNVVDTSRGTSIEKNGARIRTIEHPLAAIAGLEIDNILIEINCSETPILDGSSKPYIDVLLKAGIVEQNEDKHYFNIDEIIQYEDADRKVEMMIMPSDRFRVTTMIDFESNVLGTQHATLNDIKQFKDEIAPCRTFVFVHELEYLLENNLIKGGDVSNAIVYVNRTLSEDELTRLAKHFKRPEIKVLTEGILNNVELHFPNESARHKLLDVVGDLALVGTPLKGHIIASRPGHASNVKFAKMIKSHIDKIKKMPYVPKYDPNIPPLYDINEIKKILPHRPPFLLIDKVLSLTEEKVVGVKSVTMNEGFFVGHFPNEPIMPGVLQIEAMAQIGGVFALSKVPDPENYLTYFLKIDNARFKNKVVPGDTLLFELGLLSPFRRGICHMWGTAYVGNKIVMQAEMTAQIVKKTNS